MSAGATASTRASGVGAHGDEQHEAPYLEALVAHARRGPSRYHVPGHKGGTVADTDLLAVLGAPTLGIDLPAYVEGVDVGPEPTPLERARKLAARAWGARRTWFLVDGASEGAQAASLAMMRRDASAAVQRNVHVSTIHGLVLSGLRPTFLEPAADEELDIAHCLTPEVLEGALAQLPDASAAFVVSPSYFGIAGDVTGLAEVAHAHGVALIVDEAWGAHFPFHTSLPGDALSAGADLVISGTHKTIGSMTQSAMLHLGRDPNGLVDEGDVNRALATVQSTSPSSLLLASLDAARRMAVISGREMLERTIAGAAALRAELARVPGVDVLDERLVGRPGAAAFDPTRVVIDIRATGASGHKIYEALHRLDDVHVELATEELLVLHFGMGEDPAPHAEPLAGALERAIAASLNTTASYRRLPRRAGRGSVAMTPREAYLSRHEAVPLREAVGRVAAESLSVYPPGAATILPGERVSAATVTFVERTLLQGGRLRGSADPTAATVLVVSPTQDPASTCGADTKPQLESNGATKSSSAVRHAASHAAFEDFPARAYLEKYYSAVGPENAAFLAMIIDYVTATDAPSDRVIEVAGGPSLLSMLALTAARGEPFEHVLFTDVCQENLREVHRWLEGDPARFRHDHVLGWLEDRTGAAPDLLCSALRSSAWELRRFDWRSDPPPEWCGRFDVVASHFFAESATSTEEEFLAMMRRIPRLGRPGSIALMSFMARSKGYTIEGADFPGFDVDESTLLAYLRAAGLSLDEVFLRTVPAEEPATNPGYDGLVFVAGRLASPADPGH